MPCQRKAGKGRKEEQAEEDEEAPLGELQVGLLLHPDEVPEHVRAVQRGHRDEVEDHEEGVDEQELCEQILEGGGIAEAGGQSVEHRRPEGEEQVGERARHGDEDIVPHGLGKVAGVDGHRLRPGEKHAPRGEEEEEGGQEDRADGVHVGDRIQGGPAHHAGGVVPELAGRPRVRPLVHGEAGEKDQVGDGGVREGKVTHGGGSYAIAGRGDQRKGRLSRPPPRGFPRSRPPPRPRGSARSARPPRGPPRRGRTGAGRGW